MKTDPRPEIVEIIDDERDVFVGGTVHHDTPNRRWVGPVAATVLLAAIGYSVVTSATSSGGRVTLPTTIATTPTTVGAATTIARPAAKVVNAQYYVAQPPPFSMHFAETLGMGGNPADFTTSAIAELWATREATAVTGSWFVVSLGTHHFTGRNSYRTVVGNLAVVVEHDLASGQSRLSFTKAGDELEITAFGWADRQLLRLVKSVRRRESEFVWEDQFFTTDHTRLFGGDPSTALYGLVVARVGYTTAVPAAFGQHVIITVAGWPDDDRGIIQRFAMVATTRFAVGDLLGSVGPLATDPAESVAQWRDGDRLITVRGNLTPDAVAAIAQTVGPATDDGVQQRLEAGLTSLPQVGFGTRHTIFSGVIGDGYTATVAVSARTDLAGYVWWIGQPDASVQPRLVAGDGGVTIDTRVEHGRTYVMAKVPRSEAGAVLRVNPTGLPTVELTLVDIDPQLPDLFAAYVFVEPVTYTAQVVGNDGEPLTVWPTA